MHEHDEIAQSWIDLQQRLFTVPFDPIVGRVRGGLVFRGVGSLGHAPLITSLMRTGGDPGDKERHLLRNFRKYAYPDMKAHDSVWYWLAMGQHHGLPTRLLDWTFSPYVALHFATADVHCMDVDALVWCVDIDATVRFLPPALGAVLAAEGAHVFTAELLAEAGASLESLAQSRTSSSSSWILPPLMTAS